MTTVSRWIGDNARTYLGNATARRDYRAQLRGTRAIWLWGGYLAILILIAALTYSNTVSRGQMSVTQIQFELTMFYQTTMFVLAILMTLVAPALTATAVVSERINHSLDLVFTSPMSLKHYLVGKMISSFRYTWMLLVLALPITALSVIMGGATWADVLGSYVILSACAVVITAMGLLVSTLTHTAVAAILWTYIAVGTYVGLVTWIASNVVTSWVQAAYLGTSQSKDASWLAGLSPFYAGQSSQTLSTIAGITMPTYLVATLFAIAMSKLLVLGAAAALGRYGSPETRSLRLHTIVYTFLLGLLIASALTAAGWPVQDTTAAAGWIAVALLAFVPHIVAASSHADRKYRPVGGIFSLGDVFNGGPAGALPLLCAMALALFGGFAARLGSTGSPALVIALVWVTAFWTLWWSVGRVLATTNLELRAGRMVLVLSMLFLLGAPLPILNSGYSGIFESSPLAPYYLLYPLGPGKMVSAGMTHAIVLFSIAAILTAYAELFLKNRRRGLEPL